MMRHQTSISRATARLGCGIALGAAALGMTTIAAAEDYRPQPDQTPDRKSVV